MDTKLFGRHQPGGMFSIVDREVFPTGNIWWVGSAVTGASDAAGFGKNPDAPFATLGYATGTASAAGDTIYVLPTHAETLTATITPLAQCQIIGLGRGASRPKITGLTAIAMVTLSAANVAFKNIHFLGVTGATYIVKGVAAGTSPTFEDCILEQVAVPVVAVHFGGLLGGSYALFKGCTFLGKLNGPTYCVHFVSSAGDYWRMENCTANYLVAGLDNGVIYSNHLQLGYIIKDCTFLGLDDSVAVITSSVGTGIDGVMINTTMHVTAISASIEDLLDDAKGLGLLGCLATDDKSKWAVPISTAQASAS